MPLRLHAAFVLVLGALTSAFTPGCASEEEEADVVESSADAMTLAATASVLRWDPAATPGPEYESSKNRLLSRCTELIDELEATPVLVRFVDEGKRSDDPAKTSSRTVWKALEEYAPAVGYCARLPNAARAAAKTALIRYGNRWIDTYEGGGGDSSTDDDDPGNPINERHVIPLVLAWDMIYPQMTVTQRKRVVGFLDALDARVVRFMGRMPSSDTRRLNNWNMDALAIRAYAALVARHEERAANVQAALSSFTRKAYTAPTGWSPPRCSNIAGVGAYGSVDLQQRDAFTYHVKGLGTAMQLAALRPGFLGTEAHRRMGAALMVTKDYVTGANRHREFLCTTVEFDFGNPLRGTSWDPLTAKIDFRFARIVFPGQRAWLGAFDGPDFWPWLKVFVTGLGDRVVP